MERQFAYRLSIAVIHSIAMMMCEIDVFLFNPLNTYRL